MRRAIQRTTWIAGAVLLGGCGLLPGPSDQSFVNAPAAVRERSALPACGAETVHDARTEANVDGRQCLWAAYQNHQAAEFITTQWTIEGDPLTWIYRVLPGGAVEVFIDSTQDAWSAKTWLHLACRELALIDGAPAQPAFGPGEGCTETTIR
jgi:hypothetical protein